MSTKRVLTIVLVASAVLLAIASASSAQKAQSIAAEWTLQGRVYKGDVGIELPAAQPLEGVTVSVYGANAPFPDPDTFIRSTTTDAAGWYGHYILETDPSGYASVDTTTVSGTVRAHNWIEYAIPLDGQTPTGNKFWNYPTTVLAGRVYAGSVGDESRPLAGVVVSLYGANNPYPQVGTFVVSATTNISGWYGLDASGPFEFYHLIETDPSGYTSVGATTVSGTVRTANWIEYSIASIPLSEQVTTGNKFWDNPPPTTVGCNSCSDCSAKLNGTYDTVYLQNNITVSGGCVLFGASNVTFDCQGHTITGDHLYEYSPGIRMVGRSGNTVRNCTISGFWEGVWLTSSTNNSLISNTIQASGRGIYLDDSDGNNLSGNNLAQNTYGVYMNSADSNALTDNVMCKQTKQDIYVQNATSGNTRFGDRCDSIYNWNGSGGMDLCALTCTPNTTTTCASGSACQSALNGDFGTVILSSDLTVPGGFVIGGNHLTLDCNGHTITGTGTGAGVVLDNKIGVTVQSCTITRFGAGIELRSAWLNAIQTNTIFSNTIGISLLKTEDALKPEENSIFNNTVWQNTTYGVRLSDAEHNDFYTNNLSGNALYAVWPSGSCNNTFTGNLGGDGDALLYWHDLPAGGSVPGGNYGQVVLCNVHGATVENLRIDNGSLRNDGILLVNSGTTVVRGNWLTRTNGIAVISSTQISIYNNHVTSSQGHALSLEYSPGASVYTNTISSNVITGSAGIFVGIGSGSTQIFSNAIQNNYRGIAINNTSHVTVTGNTIKKNIEEGIAIEGSSGISLAGNTVLQNGWGLFFDNHSGQSTATGNKVCYNTNSDIYNNGLGHTGSNNTCARWYNWQDTGVTDGCSLKCIGWYQYNYGYQFANPSKDTLTLGCMGGTCQGDYVDTFGEEQVYMTMDICIGVPLCLPFVGCYCLGWEKSISTGIWDPHALLYYEVAYRNSGEPGECTGMSTTSLRFYRGDRYISQYSSTAQRVSDLAYSGSLENAIDAAHGAIVSWEIAKRYLYWYDADGQSPNDVLNQVKQSIQNNQPGSIVLMGDLTEAHTVVAAEVWESGNTARIYVYDSNYPQFSTQYAENEEAYPHITVDKVADTFQYSGGANFSAMWFLPYSDANGSFTIPLNGKQVMVGAWGSANTQVEDEGGHVIGWEGDVFTNTIAGAAPMFGWGSSQPSGQDFYILPPGGHHTAHIAGREHGNYNVAIFHANSTVLLDGVPATPATHDTLTFNYENDDPPNAVVGFETLDASKPYSLTIGERFGPSGAVRQYSIRHAHIAAGSRAIFRVTPDFNALIYTNRGPEPIAYTVEMQGSMVSPTVQVGDALPTASRAGLVIGPMSTHVLVPDNWLDLPGSQINVFVEQCGNGGCGFGEGPYNCPEDCGELLSCVPPHDDMVITRTTTLCPGVHEISDAGNPGVLTLAGNDVTLDCGGAKLIGDGEGIGILSDATSHVTITNCYIQSYATGVALNGVTHGTLAQSALVSNTWGVRLGETGAARVTRNYVWGNEGGIRLVGTNGSTLSQNLVCANGGVDIRTSGGVGNSGSDNACDQAEGWADVGRAECTYTCAPPRYIYLPLVLRNYH